MNRDALEQLMQAVQAGEVRPEEACDRLKALPFEDLGYAKVDDHRSIRSGMPEVIYAAGKTPEQVAGIFVSLASSGVNVLATRSTLEQFDAVFSVEPRARFHQLSRCITLQQARSQAQSGLTAIVCAGTSDLPVAQEAQVTAELMGNKVELIADVGVAGLHRLLAQRIANRKRRYLSSALEWKALCPRSSVAWSLRP